MRLDFAMVSMVYLDSWKHLCLDFFICKVRTRLQNFPVFIFLDVLDCSQAHGCSLFRSAKQVLCLDARKSFSFDNVVSEIALPTLSLCGLGGFNNSVQLKSNSAGPCPNSSDRN